MVPWLLVDAVREAVLEDTADGAFVNRSAT
jgi:hypothetical protein